jgi:hypothetical protein
MTLDDLARLAQTDIDPSAMEFRKPLQQDANALAQALGPLGQPVLLGSIAHGSHPPPSRCCLFREVSPPLASGIVVPR